MCLKGINLHAVIIVAENRQRQGFWEVEGLHGETLATIDQCKKWIPLSHAVLVLFACV